MTEQEKDLLLKDLCARLPYGVFVKENRNSLDDGPVIYTYDYHPHISNCKPYLRPMESMTEEEFDELSSLGSGVVVRKDVLRNLVLAVWYNTSAIEWLNKKMFDYRDLIPMGLAIETPEDMYNKMEE